MSHKCSKYILFAAKYANDIYIRARGGATWSRDVVLMRNAWVFHHTL